MEEEEEAVEEGAPAWMATFSDLATLLLTFFVLLLSFAKMDSHNFKKAIDSVKEAMGVTFTVDGAYEAISSSPVEISQTPSSPLIESVEERERLAMDQAKKVIDERGLEKKVELAATPRGVVVRIKDVLLFDLGSDVLKDEGKPALDAIVELFEASTGPLSIEGHTDNVPISSARFPSNWELSSARSVAVLRYFGDERALEVKRMHIAGYADQKPLVPQDSAENRARNRRVEFLFEYAAQVEGQKGMVPLFIDKTAKKLGFVDDKPAPSELEIGAGGGELNVPIGGAASDEPKGGAGTK